MSGQRRNDTSGEQDTQEKGGAFGRGLAAAVLVVLGLSSLAFGTVVWLDTSAPGASSVQKTSTTNVTTPADLAAKGGTTTTAVTSTDKTTPGSASLRSEAVAATLFGLGALLFLTGVFFNRVTQVTLPGGGALTLGPDAQAKLVAKAAETAEKEGLPRDPAALAALYQVALQELEKRQPPLYYPYRRSRWPGGSDWVGPGGASGWGTSGTSPGDDVIEEAVVAAAQRVAPPDDVARRR